MKGLALVAGFLLGLRIARWAVESASLDPETWEERHPVLWPSWDPEEAECP